MVWRTYSSSDSNRWPQFALLGFVVALAAQGCADDRATPADAAAADGAASPDAGDLSGPVCPPDNGPFDPTSLIDDFEDSTSAAPAIAGRRVSWYASGDATSTAIIMPLGLAAPAPIPGGRCSSRQALHVNGSGFLDWGSQVTLALDYGPNSAGVQGDLPYDARLRG